MRRALLVMLLIAGHALAGGADAGPPELSAEAPGGHQVSLQNPRITARDSALDTEVLARWVTLRKAPLQDCYDAELRKKPKLKTGRIIIRFTLTTAGHARDAGVVEDGVRSARLTKCLRSVVNGWLTIMPRPAADTEVSMTLLFREGPAWQQPRE